MDYNEEVRRIMAETGKTRKELEDLASAKIAEILASDDGLPPEVKTLPRVTNLQIDKQWQDKDGNTWASGTVIMEDGRELQHLGPMKPVFVQGLLHGYTLATPPGTVTPFGQTSCEKPQFPDDIQTITPGETHD